MSKKDYIRNTSTCSCENGKYLASITDDSLIMCDQIIEEAKTVPTKKVTSKKLLFTFLLITITYVIFNSYEKIKVDSYDSLPLEKYWLFIMY